MLGYRAITLACKYMSPGSYCSRRVMLARLDLVAHQLSWSSNSQLSTVKLCSAQANTLTAVAAIVAAMTEMAQALPGPLLCSWCCVNMCCTYLSYHCALSIVQSRRP